MEDLAYGSLGMEIGITEIPRLIQVFFLMFPYTYVRITRKRRNSLSAAAIYPMLAKRSRSICSARLLSRTAQPLSVKLPSSRRTIGAKYTR